MSYGKLIQDGGGIPIGQGYIPNVGFTGSQSSPMSNTDSSSNQTTGFVAADQIQVGILLGKGYVATTGTLATATNGNLVMGASLFNPLASGKNIYIYSIKWSCAAATPTLKYYATTADPAYANTLTPQNLKLAGSASTASVTSAANAATASLTPTGTQHDLQFVNAQGTFEFLLPGTGIFLPSGAANGISVFGTVVSVGANWGATFRYIEY